MFNRKLKAEIVILKAKLSAIVQHAYNLEDSIRKNQTISVKTGGTSMQRHPFTGTLHWQDNEASITVADAIKQIADHIGIELVHESKPAETFTGYRKKTKVKKK